MNIDNSRDFVLRELADIWVKLDPFNKFGGKDRAEVLRDMIAGTAMVKDEGSFGRRYRAWFDGASVQTPDGYAAGAGIVVRLNGRIIVKESRSIDGEVRGPVAEYMALELLCEHLKRIGVKQVTVFGDSAEVLVHASGRADRPISDPVKRGALSRIAELTSGMDVMYCLISRDGNREAHNLAKSARLAGTAYDEAKKSA